MSIALPTPPPGSPFRAEYDEQGRVRLSWRARFDWKNDLIVLAVLLAFSAYLVFFARGIMGPAAACVVAVVLGAWKVYTFLRRLNADQLILGDSVLRYDYEDHSKLGRQVREIPRAEVGPIRLESVPEGPRQRPRPRLTLDRGADRLVIRRVSRECDLEWLAGVLRAWAGGEQRLAPPPGSAHLPAPRLSSSATPTAYSACADNPVAECWRSRNGGRRRSCSLGSVSW